MQGHPNFVSNWFFGPKLFYYFSFLSANISQIMQLLDRKWVWDGGGKLLLARRCGSHTRAHTLSLSLTSSLPQLSCSHTTTHWTEAHSYTQNFKFSVSLPVICAWTHVHSHSQHALAHTHTRFYQRIPTLLSFPGDPEKERLRVYACVWVRACKCSEQVLWMAVNA